MYCWNWKLKLREKKEILHVFEEISKGFLNFFSWYHLPYDPEKKNKSGYLPERSASAWSAESDQKKEITTKDTLEEDAKEKKGFSSSHRFCKVDLTKFSDQQAPEVLSLIKLCLSDNKLEALFDLEELPDWNWPEFLKTKKVLMTKKILKTTMRKDLMKDPRLKNDAWHKGQEDRIEACHHFGTLGTDKACGTNVCGRKGHEKVCSSQIGQGTPQIERLWIKRLSWLAKSETRKLTREVFSRKILSMWKATRAIDTKLLSPRGEGGWWCVGTIPWRARTILKMNKLKNTPLSKTIQPERCRIRNVFVLLFVLLILLWSKLHLDLKCY